MASQQHIKSFDPRGGQCDVCGKHRSLRNGLCHECEQAERDAALELAGDDEYVAPGLVGARL
jgi:hypothetical protein